ncbi:hypothetical protein L5M43_15000 [Shewanella sp. SW36]|uniref:hypothetical protein n=1 Tax=Shewanella TaxID=22 RepID=UPI0018E2D8ED|nr:MULTISPECIES: hypothetical protein [unclassified Shewanella]GCF88607.1 hypothetical protein SMBr_08510 [Shewanella sp. M-Br]MBI1674149.1 hypothetical protein [Shewanella sp. DW31]MCU7976549.1 hypothetical protein [Shewanella sp. SW36]MCU7991789.1 hypothetical protein [Shewanella sp. SW1]MCU8002592.1 hypothetical protein [Shewanella sp. SM96]
MDDAALELQKLDALIAKGKMYVILVFGVFFWGMLTSLVVALIHYFISGDPFWAELQRALYIYPIGGILFGWFVWVQINRKRDKLRSQ